MKRSKYKDSCIFPELVSMGLIQTCKLQLQPRKRLKNGKIFPAFDIHRHGLAAAYLLNKQSNRNMFRKPDQAETLTANGGASTENMKSITDGMSDVTIVNKEYWKPVPRHKMGRRISCEDRFIDTEKKKSSSFSSSSSVYSSRTRTGEDDRSVSRVRDKLEEQKATAEMELSAKSCIESCAEFKLLFVPGYELDCPEQFYEDPVPKQLTSGSVRRLSTTTQDQFKNRLFALSKLEDETTSNEDRQKRFETLFCVSKYNGAYKERRLMNDKRSQTVAAAHPACSLTERQTPIKAKPTQRSYGRRNRTRLTAKGCNSMEDLFGSSRNTAQSLLSECQELGFDRTSSEDTDSAQGSEIKAENGVEKNKKPGRRREGKCSGSSALKPTKFYDINEIATTCAVSCEDRIKDGGRRKNKNSAPGKSYFSQRRNSLTKKPQCKRPATAIVRKKKLHSQRRPNTANIDTRSMNSNDKEG